MDEVRKRLVDGLNELLQGEYIAMIHYAQHAGSVGGLNYENLVRWLRREAIDEMGHAIVLTQAILSLGGVPRWEIGASHPFGEQDARDPRKLLEHDLEHEKALIRKYMEVIEIAEEARELGVKVLLENILGEEQQEQHVIERMLADV